MEASPAEMQRNGHHPAEPQETVLQLVHPRESGGFSLPDLTDPSQLVHGDTLFDTYKGKASIARAKVCWNYHVPENFSREASLIIAHGLGAKQGAYSGLAKYLASHGIATAEYKAPHYQDLLAGLHPKHIFDASRLLYQAPWGVIRELQNRDDIDGPLETIDVVGHSLGGRTAVKNAHQHPRTIGNVILIDSIGLEDHNIPGLAGRLPFFFGKDFKGAMAGDELETEEKIKLVINGIVYFVENPLRSGGEIWSLSKARIGDEVAALEEHGQGSAIIAPPEDSLISPDKTAEKSSDKPDLFVRLPMLREKKLDHMGPIRYPEIYGRTVISVLDYLDNIRV